MRVATLVFATAVACAATVAGRPAWAAGLPRLSGAEEQQRKNRCSQCMYGKLVEFSEAVYASSGRPVLQFGGGTSKDTSRVWVRDLGGISISAPDMFRRTLSGIGTAVGLPRLTASDMDVASACGRPVPAGTGGMCYAKDFNPDAQLPPHVRMTNVATKGHGFGGVAEKIRRTSRITVPHRFPNP